MVLFQEIFGNKGLGDGALDFFMADFLKMKVPVVLNEWAGLEAQKGMLTRPINSIFTELGFDRNEPIRAQEPSPLADRLALDSVIFDALGLSPEERREVYWATAELVKQRLDKAGSRKK